MKIEREGGREGGKEAKALRYSLLCLSLKSIVTYYILYIYNYIRSHEFKHCCIYRI